MRRSGLLLILCVSFIYFPGVGNEERRAGAAQDGVEAAQKKRHELKQMEVRKKEIQLYLKESYLAEQDVRNRILELSLDFETLQQQIVQTTREQKHTDHVLSRQTKAVEHLKKRLEQHEHSIQQRVRSIYRVLKGRQVLSFFQNNLSLKNSRLMAQVLRHEILLLEDFKKKRQSLEKMLKPYQQRQDIQEKLFQESSEIKQFLQQKQEEHQHQLLSIQQDQQVYFRYLDELQQSMEQVIEELDYLEHQEKLAEQFKKSQGLFPLKGKLPLPVEGRLIQSFRTKKQGSEPLLYRGITVETHQESVVSAIAPGKVVFADALKGYHQLVIVDHGSDSFSVYGKLKQLKVFVEEFVDVGAVIGTVSQEPITRKYHIYFEIRYKGKSVNPLHWFRSGTYQ